MPVYSFRDGPVVIRAGKKADPQKIGESLAKISQDNNGRLTPPAVVEAARSPRHPLHRHFTWDDAKAAHHYRLEQARELIRIIRVEDEDPKKGVVRAFISVRADGPTSYRTVGEVEGSATLQNAVLDGAERDLLAFERRFASLRSVCHHVARAREEIERQRQARVSTAA